MNLFQLMATDNCRGFGPVIAFIKYGVFPIIQIGIPILLILMGTLDLGKAVVSNDEKEIKSATSKLIKRAIMAVAVFFVTTIVTAVLGWIGKGGSGVNVNPDDNEPNWSACWENPMRK